ncbi:MAG: HypC/HybG/HupF family hydrogenase formation chaperone [Pirellulaceae bacterium]
MCLGIPGRVVETYQEQGILMGKIDFGGIAKRICLECTPDVQPGQYVLVHVGFALQIIDEREAQQVFEFLARMDELGESGSEGLPDASSRPAQHPGEP